MSGKEKWCKYAMYMVMLFRVSCRRFQKLPHFALFPDLLFFPPSPFFFITRRSRLKLSSTPLHAPLPSQHEIIVWLRATIFPDRCRVGQLRVVVVAVVIHPPREWSPNLSAKRSSPRNRLQPSHCRRYLSLCWGFWHLDFRDVLVHHIIEPRVHHSAVVNLLEFFVRHWWANVIDLSLLMHIRPCVTAQHRREGEQHLDKDRDGEEDASKANKADTDSESAHGDIRCGGCVVDGG